MLMDKDLRCKTDNVGSMIPAVPHPTGGWWQYTSIPVREATWWRELPTYLPGRTVKTWKTDRRNAKTVKAVMEA